MAAILLAGAAMREWRRLVPRILYGALLPMGWHIACRCAGASLDGYHPFLQLDLVKAFLALGEVLRYAFGNAWTYAFSFPLALVALMICGKDDLRSLWQVVGAVLLICAGLMLIFSLSDAVDFDWHLESMERLLWVPAFLLAREALPRLFRQ